MFLFHANSVIPDNRIVPTIGRKNARNPLTGKTIAFASETEMLKWIEYRSHPDRW
jgi:hypothetical protein